jgi:hypothetical protein
MTIKTILEGIGCVLVAYIFMRGLLGVTYEVLSWICSALS